MPCYEVSTCNTKLEAANPERLDAALKTINYDTTATLVNHKTKGKVETQLSFSRGKVIGYLKGDQLHIEAPKGTKIDVDEIKRAYGQQVLNKIEADYKAKGWTRIQVGNKVTFEKPRAQQQQQKQQVGFQR
jgi:hypothetical protein